MEPRGPHDFGKASPRSNAFQRQCLWNVLLLRMNTEKGRTKQLTAKNVKHSIRTFHPARLWCEEMRLILWNGDPNLTRRRNGTGLLDSTSK